MRLGLGVLISLCLAYTAGFGVYRLRDEALGLRSTVPEEMEVFWEAWERVESHLFDEPPSAKVRTYGALRSSLTLLDPYTVFVEPIPRELEQDQLRGAYGGIGVAVRQERNGRIVLDPYPASPAERAGLTTGDVLLSIDGESLDDRATTSAIQSRLRGEIGTRVQVTVRRSSGITFDASIERATIEVPSVMWRIETPQVGYVQLIRFTERTDDEVGRALESLTEAGVEGVVLDLRGNRGGLLNTAVAVASRFLQEGDVVVHQVGRTEERTSQVPSSGDLTTPLVVLVDEGTASAAEIVGGALQDHDRAPLMGEPTFGKGSVQEIYDLSDGSSIHITSAIWLTPEHHRIDNNGLEPDLPVLASDTAGDEALNAAIDYLESE